MDDMANYGNTRIRIVLPSRSEITSTITAFKCPPFRMMVKIPETERYMRANFIKKTVLRGNPLVAACDLSIAI